jgi:hypothetical protein
MNPFLAVLPFSFKNLKKIQEVANHYGYFQIKFNALRQKPDFWERGKNRLFT